MTETAAGTFFPTRQATGGALTVHDPAAVAAAEAAKARIQSAYIMALQKPRNEMESRDRILMACRRSEFAERAEYSKPIGGSSIKGPSIRFAELALREWGNIMSEVQTLYEDDDIRRVRVSVLDLETNAQFTKDVQIKKAVERRSKKGREDDVIGERKNTYNDTVYILRATDEEMYTKEAAWVSKVLRNEGLRLIPTDIIEEGMETARKTVSNRAKQDPEGEKKRVLDAFSSVGVKPKDLEKYLGHGINTVSPAELVNLRTVYQSIREGTPWSDYISGDGRPADNGENHDADPPDTSDFDRLANEKPHDSKMLVKFLGAIAKNEGCTAAEVKAEAAKNFGTFWQQFSVWSSNQDQPEPHNPSTGPDEKPAPAESDKPVEGLPNDDAEKLLANYHACRDSFPEEFPAAVKKVGVKDDKNPTVEQADAVLKAIDSMFRG